MKYILSMVAVLLLAATADAGWHYSAYPQQGYSYYPAGWYGGAYYNSGYWYYEKPAVLVTQYVPYPVVFNAYATVQPGAAAVYQTSTLAAVPALARVPVPASVQGTVGVPVTAAVQQGVAAPVDPCEAKMRAFEDRIMKAIDARLGGGPQQLRGEAPKQQSRGQVVFMQRCAKCHDAAVANEVVDGKAKGGGIVLARDGQPEMTEQQVDRCVRKIVTLKMPPPQEAKLGEEEGAALLEFFDKLKTK